jgi:hypothetical protein
MAKPMKELIQLINQVCGLPEEWAKTCIYYTASTYFLTIIDWIIALVLLGKPDTGKSYLLRLLRNLSFQPVPIALDERTTEVSLRNKLIEANQRTAIIEEADLYRNRRALESYIINRVGKFASTPSITEQVVKPSGAKDWKTTTHDLFGTTIIHDRNGLTDLAAERRSIIAPLARKPSQTFHEITEEEASKIKLVDYLPKFHLAPVPDIFQAPETSGSALNAYKP